MKKKEPKDNMIEELGMTEEEFNRRVNEFEEGLAKRFKGTNSPEEFMINYLRNLSEQDEGLAY